MPKSTGEDWLTTGDASRFLGVTLRTVYRFIGLGMSTRTGPIVLT